MANGVADSALHGKSIFMRVSNVHGLLILDSFPFRLPPDDCNRHHLWSAASRLMSCVLITWAEMLLCSFMWPLSLPPFMPAAFLWKLQPSNRKCSFRFYKSWLGATRLTWRPFISVFSAFLGLLQIRCSFKQASHFVICLMFWTVLMPVWLCLIAHTLYAGLYLIPAPKTGVWKTSFDRFFFEYISFLSSWGGMFSLLGCGNNKKYNILSMMYIMSHNV